jgi:hypothetical protein
MKPFKSGKPIAIWMLRIALIPVLFQLYNTPISTLNYTSMAFYLGICMFVCGVLIIIGGIFSKPGFTIISGLLIFSISTYKIILSYNGIFDTYIAMHLIPISLGFFFFTNGNEI